MLNHIKTFKWHPPGQRIIKTSLAVTLCLLFYYFLKGFQGETMPAEAAITAIICLQPYVNSTKESGFIRLAGTVIGAIWGFLFLLGMHLFPVLGSNRSILYLLMGIGTLVALHSAVLFHLPDASGLAAIVFVCVVIAYPDIENPLNQAFLRIFDVMLGATIAILVNGVHLPRVKQHNKVFFIPLTDLADPFSAQLPPPVMFRLQSLLSKGAKICLTSPHAPTFQAAQFGSVKFNVPMIVMDGAAIYDPNENVYLATTNLNPSSCRWLMKYLDDYSYFIYTVHRDRNCIYHHGELTELEDTVYRYLKRSPYRYYLEDDHFSVSDVVYIKLVTTRERAVRLQRELEPMLSKMKLRSVIRSQPGLEEGCSLYFYAAHADIAHAQAHLIQLLRQENADVEICDLSDAQDRPAETDAIRLLQKADAEFEPLFISKLLRKKDRRYKLAVSRRLARE